MGRVLEGCLVLVLEDDFLAALEVQQMVESFGGTVVGPVGRLDLAQKLARQRSLDGAILDIQLDHRTSYSLARELLDAGVVVVFLTGYGPGSVEPEFRDVPRLGKPFDRPTSERVLKTAFDRGP